MTQAFSKLAACAKNSIEKCQELLGTRWAPTFASGRYLASSIVDGSHSAMLGNIVTSATATHIRKNSGSA